MRVREIMKNVVTIRKDAPLKDALQLMVSKGVGCLIVAENDSILGIITERDAMKQISDSTDSLKRPVNDLMSKKVITIEASRDLNFAAELMSENKIKKLPVVDGKKLVGIITSTDIVANASDLNEMSLF
jgi:CBS domain-containing protein